MSAPTTKLGQASRTHSPGIWPKLSKSMTGFYSLILASIFFEK